MMGGLLLQGPINPGADHLGKKVNHRAGCDKKSRLVQRGREAKTIIFPALQPPFLSLSSLSIQAVQPRLQPQLSTSSLQAS